MTITMATILIRLASLFTQLYSVVAKQHSILEILWPMHNLFSRLFAASNFLNMFEDLPATDFDHAIVRRPLRLVVRFFCDRLRLSRSTIHKMVAMLFKV